MTNFLLKVQAVYTKEKKDMIYFNGKFIWGNTLVNVKIMLVKFVLKFETQNPAEKYFKGSGSPEKLIIPEKSLRETFTWNQVAGIQPPFKFNKPLDMMWKSNIS